LHSAIGNKNPRFCYHHDEMNRAPSIGVVLPTLNCAHLLPDHLASMQPWLDLVEQIVVVDSHSEDGSSEMLQKRLAGHPRVTFHQRPRGLYQSWNFGISQLETDFTYISTVGDSITRPGLEHLRAVATDLRADVVVSKPAFIEENGEPVQNGPRWPIDDVVEALQLGAPCLLDQWTLCLFLLENPVDAILGSSASNLYLTQLLKSRPFPTEYGTVGDGAWGFANVFHYRLAVTPTQLSTFRRHEKSYAAATYAVDELRENLFDLLVRSFESVMTANPHLNTQADRLNYSHLIKTVEQRMLWQKRLEGCRKQPLPWALNPWAWCCRRMRNSFRSQASHLRTQALRVMDATCQSTSHHLPPENSRVPR